MEHKHTVCNTDYYLPFLSKQWLMPCVSLQLKCSCEHLGGVSDLIDQHGVPMLCVNLTLLENNSLQETGEMVIGAASSRSRITLKLCQL